MDIYLGVDSQVTVLFMNREQESNPAVWRERERVCKLYTCVYRIRDYVQVAGILKAVG